MRWSAAVSIVTGWSEPVPGRELQPLKSSAFHGARLRQQSIAEMFSPGVANCFTLTRTVMEPTMAAKFQA